MNPARPFPAHMCHLQQRRRTTKPKSSPLASSTPINAESNATLRQILELNANSVQTSQLTEQTISKIIERSQNSVLTGLSSRPPTNFANQDVVARTIEANHLTIHSLHEFDVGTMEPGQSEHESSPYYLFLQEKPGFVAGTILVTVIFVGHGFRFLFGM